MKTSSFLASLLLGSVALAAPLDRRALATKTETVIETQVIYVTVWDGQVPAAQPTTTAPGLFYEQPASSKPEPTTTSSSSQSPPEQKPTSEQPPQPTVAPTSTKEEPAPVYTPPPVQTSTDEPKPAPTQPPTEQPKPEPSTPAPAPAPAPSAPAAPPAYNPPSGGGNQKSGDMTYYETLNDPGACGKGLKDDVPSAAISAAIWGNDVWGSADNINGNPMCSKSVTVTYNGKSITVPVKDRCAGCKADDVDLTPAAWNYLTGNAFPGRETVSWTFA